MAKSLGILPQIVPGTLTVRGIVDGKVVEHVFKIDENGPVQHPLEDEFFTVTITHDANDANVLATADPAGFGGA